MYPQRVGRIVLDGVCDAKTYVETRWTSNLREADAVEASFYDLCFAAGVDKCPLYEASPLLIKKRVYAIREMLKQSPIPIHSSQAEQSTLFTAAVLDTLTFQSLYFPIQTFAMLARVLVGAENRDSKALAEYAGFFSPPASCDCDGIPRSQLLTSDANAAIACSDQDHYTYDPQSFGQWYGNMSTDSPRFAPIWGNYYLRCAAWTIRPKWRYTGEFAAHNTSHPLLLLSPKYDTVCPAAQARAVHARFPGSALLIQDTRSHTSPSTPSICTAKHIRVYFRDGTLPEDGTVCGVDELPFIGEVAGSDVSEDDRKLLDTLKAFARSIP